MKSKFRIADKHAFTLMELLVVIGIITILAGLLLPALARAKAKANSIKCLNDIRQLNLAATMYVGDHDGEYPPRRRLTNAWMATLKPYYLDQKILKCPSDSYKEWRSYLINGFNDYWVTTLSSNDYRKVMLWVYPHGMKQSAVPLPSETVLFSEKRIGSFHVHMDFGQGAGNDTKEVAHNMHKSGGAKSGGSNYAFVDGSARFLKYNACLKPVNLWGITDVVRNTPVDLP